MEEGVDASKADNAESADLDDLISAVMDDIPDEEAQSEEKKRSTSTPSKDDGGTDDTDFGGFLSMIRDDSEQPPPPVQDKKEDDEEPRDIPLDRRSGANNDSLRQDFGKVKLHYWRLRSRLHGTGFAWSRYQIE